MPSCDDGHTQLWNGYSVSSFEYNDSPISQDLGSSGSCVQEFTIVPALSCGQNGICGYGSRSDRSYWLSTTVIGTTGNQGIKRHISRCVVCQVPRAVITLHSQTDQIPICPSGWKGLWQGYSFLKV